MSYDEIKYAAFTDELEKTAWNKAKAARLLDISRRTIYRKMQEHNIIQADEV